MATDIVTLGTESNERIKAIIINRRLFILHKLIALTIFGSFIYLGVEDQSAVENYRGMGLFIYVAFTFIQFLSANLFASLLMWIPSCIFSQLIPSQIVLGDNHLIYVGGSVALHYEIGPFSFVRVFSFFQYLLGIEDSYIIKRSDIISVEIVEAKFFRSAYGIGQWLAITHKNGKLLTGISLNDSFKRELIEKINTWRNQ